MRRLLLLVLLTAAVLAGCGGSATPDGTVAAAGDAAAGDSVGGPLYGELTAVDGTPLDGSGYRNASLALWFWAPW